MKEIIFVTSNKGKVATAQKHLSNVKITHYDYDIKEPKVNDIDFIAEFKVKEAFKKVQKPCISLDAGFFIPAYPNNPNFPGAFPRRDLLEKIGIEGLIENMKGVTDRRCYFKECLCFYDGKKIKKFYGMSEGKIALSAKGDCDSKSWSELWKVFIPDGFEKTMAEMSEEERKTRKVKNPFLAFKEYLEKEDNVKVQDNMQDNV